MTMAAEIKKRMAAQPLANRGPGSTVQPGAGKSVGAQKSGCC